MKEEMDGRKLTFSEEARLSGKEPLTTKAQHIMRTVANKDWNSPVLQDAIVTHDLMGGKIAAVGDPHAPAGTDMVATPDHEMKMKSMRKMEYSMKGTLTRNDGYNRSFKSLITGNLLKKPGLPKESKV